MLPKNSYIVHAFEINNTTGALQDKMIEWQKDHQSLVAPKIFHIDAEFDRWKPYFTDISACLHKLKSLHYGNQLIQMSLFLCVVNQHGEFAM